MWIKLEKRHESKRNFVNKSVDNVYKLKEPRPIVGRGGQTLLFD